MSDKLKLISTSAAIVILTSTLTIIDTNKTSANPFSNLWKKLKVTSNSLTISNPFKPSNSGSNELNKPNSKAKLSNNSKPSSSLYSRLKSFFTKGSDKSYNITTEDNTKANTITHTLKGDDNKPASKSKQKRVRLAAAYDNDTESLTSNIISSDDSNNTSGSNKQIKTKNKPKTSNPSVSFDKLSISSEDSSSSSETKINSNKNPINSDLISELKSELEVRLILMDEELNNKSILEKDINRSNDVNIKKALYLHLGVSNEKISNLESEIKTIEQLIKSLQN
ncbi:MAG TPA: hypothetical protein H9923_04240 [Candidatus Dwaynia gallinarum]|nr:hypothetical protein [Candidatus Dwaynia gallinarum]